MTPQITVDRNYVTIQGVKIERRQSCGPSEWLEFWAQLDQNHQHELRWTNMSDLDRRDLKAAEAM